MRVGSRFRPLCGENILKRRPIGRCDWLLLIGILLGLLVLAACRSGIPGTIQATPINGVSETTVLEAPPTATEIPSPTPIPPTPTPTEPMAALVNGQPIYLDDYERELARYEQAVGAEGQRGGGAEEQGSEGAEEILPSATADPQLDVTPTPEVGYQTQVLNALIERELILQAAAAAGVIVDPAAVEAHVEELRSSAGEASNFEAWLEANLFTEEEFREALAAEMVTEQIVSLVTAAVPQTTEQVRARYIQVNDLALAQELVKRIRNGDDFAFLAQQNSLDRLTGENGGDLGFFARGALLVSEVEAAAFALQPGETSDVITATDANGQTTYYIVQVTEQDPNRALTADMRHALLQQTFDAWLDQLWEQATIEQFVGQ